MPRNGSDIFSILPGTEGVPDTTIESAKYNSYIHDVETDLNLPRPIVAGGTGANDADEALANLGAEKSSQKVTNYDTHIFRPGSLYSDTAATAAPVLGHAFVGWAVSSDVPADPPANQNVVVHARDQTTTVPAPGRLYVREKKAGVWGPWGIDGSGIAGDTPPLSPPDGALWWDNVSGQLFIYYRDVDSAQWVIASPVPDPALFLLKAGDTMAGNLTLMGDPVNPYDAASKNYVDYKAATVDLSSKVSKSGDTMTGMLTVNAPILSAQAGGQGSYYFGTAAKYLYYDSANFNLNGGDLQLTGGTNVRCNDLYTSRAAAPTTGTVYFGNTITKYLNFDGTNFVLAGAPLTVGNDISVTGQVTCSQNFQSSGANVALGGNGGGVYLRPNGVGNAGGQFVIDNAGIVTASNQIILNAGSFVPPNGVNGGFRCKTGDTNTVQANYFNFGWDGATGLHAYVDQTHLGSIAPPSDYRIKKDVAPLPSTWDAVKKLKPIKYTAADYTPKGSEAKLSTADDIERWGFIAHELQETLTSSVATGEKDAPNILQSPNPLAVIAALTKALQEAMARIEALEAA